ncbi:CRP-like cAMP-binding protein [Lacibacter cauensis]|uniref:CRP-like cAMP-binding protein n=1 Tax=Lacibacter cauensis TaxID=510947 RepID=A0A562SH09_9BACT|nr:Crp/Fnr family transcriptional regulator [Lacibacter cauensis]TWI80565.1 CRP-like cAMP-binding protein [Lacibacter cauensis]
MHQLPPDFTGIFYVLNNLHPQPSFVSAYFQQHLEAVTYTKGSLLLEAGSMNEFVYFIEKGIVRGFIRDAGKDITTWISCENEFVTSISGLVYNAPALESIETIEHCSLYRMPVAALDKLYSEYPEFNITARILYQRYYGDAERRAFIARLSAAEDRYRFFLDYYAHLANRVPLKFIASFLGITVETLSRVRKKLSIQY